MIGKKKEKQKKQQKKVSKKKKIWKLRGKSLWRGADRTGRI